MHPTCVRLGRRPRLRPREPVSGSECAPRAGPSTQAGPSPQTPRPMRGPGDYTTSCRRRVEDSTWHVRPACLLVGTCVRSGPCLQRMRREGAREKIEVAGAAGRRRALGRGGACVPAGAGSPSLLLRGHVAARARGSCMHGVTGARPASWRPHGEGQRGGGSILGAHLAPGAWSSPPGASVACPQAWPLRDPEISSGRPPYATLRCSTHVL